MLPWRHGWDILPRRQSNFQRSLKLTFWCLPYDFDPWQLVGGNSNIMPAIHRQGAQSKGKAKSETAMYVALCVLRSMYLCTVMYSLVLKMFDVFYWRQLSSARWGADRSIALLALPSSKTAYSNTTPLTPSSSVRWWTSAALAYQLFPALIPWTSENRDDRWRWIKSRNIPKYEKRQRQINVR